MHSKETCNTGFLLSRGNRWSFLLFRWEMDFCYRISMGFFMQVHCCCCGATCLVSYYLGGYRIELPVNSPFKSNTRTLLNKPTYHCNMEKGSNVPFKIAVTAIISTSTMHRLTIIAIAPAVHWQLIRLLLLSLILLLISYSLNLLCRWIHRRKLVRHWISTLASKIRN